MCLPCVQVATPPIVPAKQLSRAIYETETRSLDRQEFSLNQPLKCPHRYFSSLHSFFIYVLLKKIVSWPAYQALPHVFVLSRSIPSRASIFVGIPSTFFKKKIRLVFTENPLYITHALNVEWTLLFWYSFFAIGMNTTCTHHDKFISKSA